MSENNSSNPISQPMKIMKPDTRPSNQGPVENFTGVVEITPLVKGEEPSCLACAQVAFNPGARSAWHTHPRGQLLIVTKGIGLIQQWGGQIQMIQQGDVIWTPPQVKHWHGATPTSTMTHTAIQESLNGVVVEWLEKVTDEEYGSFKPM